MNLPFDEFGPPLIERYGLLKKTDSEFGKKPCPNCGGDDRFWINNYNGILYHHCRQRCDFVEREKAMQRDGLLLTDYNANQIPYHVTKQIPLLGKAYLDGDNVIIPLMGVSSGEKRGTQTIKPNSSKLFSKGMTKEGCGCFIGENSNILYVCEGWATAVAVHMATGEQVLFALDAKTLVKTVRRLQHPRIIIAGDNDPEGVKAASKANFPYALPEKEGWDWWDVFNALGTEGVKEQIDKVWDPKDLATSTSEASQVSVECSPDQVNWFCFSDLEEKPLPPRQWLVENWIPLGQPSLFYGDGGTGKSLAALQLMIAVASGNKWFGLQTDQGSSMYLTAEDDVDELHRRIDKICWTSEINYSDLKNAHSVSLVGQDALLANQDFYTKSLNPTSLFHQIEDKIKLIEPKLVVVDTLADVFPGDENQRAQARQFISLLRKPAHKYNCAVVVLAHPSLSGLNSGSGTSGSTAWSNSVRSRFYLKRLQDDDPDKRVLTLEKNNYARIGNEINLRWEDGCFKFDPQSSGLDFKAASYKAQRVFLRLLEEHIENGQNVNKNGGSTYAPKVFANHPNNEGVTKNAFTTAMRSLLAEEKIISEKTARSSRLVVNNA